MERRNFIKGSAIAAISIAAQPVAAVTVSTVDRGAWDSTLIAYERAAARLDAHCAEPCPNKREAIDLYESTTEALATAHADIFDRLMLVPAPTPNELAYKLEQWVKVVRGDCWNSAYASLSQIAADARRFANR